MKSTPFLLTFISSCTAFVVPFASRNISNHLEARINQQQLINPDNEPNYVDIVTTATMEKSRILSGVGPPAADSRFFDWDESCTDPAQRQQIFLSWLYFQDLTTRASTQLAALRAGLPQPPQNQGNANPQNEAAIIQLDPAYSQMFDKRDVGLQYVQDSFARVTANVQNFAGRGNGGPAALRFICNADNHVTYPDGSPLCGTGPAAAQGMAMVPQAATGTNIERRYSFQTSSSIVFCPVFFDDEKFPNIDAIVGQPNSADLTLDSVDCRERIMLHEYMHLPWVRNMNPKRDYVGYLDAAGVAAQLGWGTNSAMPECYAWYALYSYFNNDHAGCGRDAWPPGMAKPVATS